MKKKQTNKHTYVYDMSKSMRENGILNFNAHNIGENINIYSFKFCIFCEELIL